MNTSSRKIYEKMIYNYRQFRRVMTDIENICKDINEGLKYDTSKNFPRQNGFKLLEYCMILEKINRSFTEGMTHISTQLDGMNLAEHHILLAEKRLQDYEEKL